ncbi:MULTISPECIES: TauD/TfdA family dioxygenase [unclassified Modestobacter]|uniref:TauD/TfdA family dioxygenase n=1 Tax=unclassified Modestobacter TaxID=2643866 RepID=UPI0022AB371B|nr:MULTISPECIES: TauD/TfdA family dioxygenase [unclassified Modestobacter]MCZ2814126.1 TauD/TfdA family dioxygenase [Modestobacter sp. VKM Ac-2979]MCZ2844458.1 TauD/TfdA family dioxygenase [Modestobacter sp. VKM Ac-2980]MCZ2848849.1 TauD/TfdA family dioxygenase [Modestobacter sp. VKM Ac-2978]
MAARTSSGRRVGAVRPELSDLLRSTGVLPQSASTPEEARELLARDGAVVVAEPTPGPEALPVVAAQLYGDRLRQLFAVRPLRQQSGELLGLHSDGAHVVVDVHGRTVNLRDPDEDGLLQRCVRPAPEGGDSFLVDGYALVDALATGCPELHAFLTGTDVDYFGGWATAPHEVPRTPLVRRLVEHTRAGRRVVRSSETAVPVPREPRAAEHDAQLDLWADVLATAVDVVPHFRLEAGEVLVVDNYRCLHGRDPFTGQRDVDVLTVMTADAW